jgi:hypothetical protein
MGKKEDGGCTQMKRASGDMGGNGQTKTKNKRKQSPNAALSCHQTRT